MKTALGHIVLHPAPAQPDPVVQFLVLLRRDVECYFNFWGNFWGFASFLGKAIVARTIANTATEAFSEYAPKNVPENTLCYEALSLILQRANFTILHHSWNLCSVALGSITQTF